MEFVQQRIAILVPTLAVAGGSVRVATWMANALSEYYKIELVSCAPLSKFAFPLMDSVQVHSLNLDDSERVLRRVRQSWTQLSELFSRFKPQIVFGIGTYETLFAFGPSRKVGAEVVFCDHGALINQWSDVKMRAIRAIDAFLAKKTIVLTQANADDYARKLGIAASKLLVIPNAVPNEFCHDCADVSVKKIVWAGRLSKEKGVEYLIDVASRVLPDRKDWTWDVYGAIDPMLPFDPVHQTIERGIGDQLIFKGASSNMAKVYRGYSIGALTSHREGFSLFLLECKASGIPVVSFAVPHGPSELIRDGVDGYLVDPFDIEAYAIKLGRLMDDEALRLKMAAAAADDISRYQEDAILGKWKALIEELNR